MHKTTFIGHRNFYAPNLEEKLFDAIKKEIDNGCRSFIMGTHGAFDKLALATCKKIRKLQSDIEIEVVITSLAQIKKIVEYDNTFGKFVYTPYDDVKTLMYEIEDIYFKKKITISNQKMIDECDTLICYVDETRNISGAKQALQYAKHKGLKILNLYN